MSFILGVIVLLAILGTAWFTSAVCAVWAVYASTNPVDMIHLVLRDVYACIIVGVVFYFVFPMGHMVTMFLTVRMVFMIIVDWATMVEQYDFIKNSVDV